MNLHGNLSTLVLILGLIIVSTSLLSESLVIPSEVVIASLAPDFSATDIDGNHVTLSGFRGRVVVLDFMTRWCGACWSKVDEVLIPFWSEYKDKDVVMITICWDASASELRGLRAGHPGMDWCLISDPDAYPIAVQYNLRTTPTITIVDKPGYIRHEYESGYSPNLTLTQLKEWVDGLMLE